MMNVCGMTDLLGNNVQFVIDMRTLKFRVYIPEHEKFSYFELGNFDYSDRYLSQDKYPVQQFTGLQDSKGVDIYEGDILNVKGYDDWFDQEGHYYKLTVEWKQCDDGDVAESYGYLYFPKDREVVGNIFENEA